MSTKTMRAAELDAEADAEVRRLAEKTGITLSKSMLSFAVLCYLAGGNSGARSMREMIAERLTKPSN